MSVFRLFRRGACCLLSRPAKTPPKPSNHPSSMISPKLTSLAQARITHITFITYLVSLAFAVCRKRKQQAPTAKGVGVGTDMTRFVNQQLSRLHSVGCWYATADGLSVDGQPSVTTSLRSTPCSHAVLLIPLVFNGLFQPGRPRRRNQQKLGDRSI